MKPPLHRIARQIRFRPRLFLAAGVSVLIALFLPHAIAGHLVTRCLIAWNAGADLYILLATIMMLQSSEAQVRARAKEQDEGQWVILGLVAVSTIASLAAIAGELAVVRDLHGFARIEHVALAGLTVLSSWAFTQIMFALHYAHDYYSARSIRHTPGLLFPGDEPPGYGDFFYFSAVIGTSGQTADVAFVSRAMRRTGTLHCILAYLFNTTVLALLINIGAGLF